MTRRELTEYIAQTYGVTPDTPWENSPEDEVFRHENNRKWFALAMRIPKRYIGLKGDEPIDVVNMKCDPLMVGALLSEDGFFPAYHMNKDRWITAALDGSADDDRLKMVLDISYELTAVRIKKTKRKNKE